MSFRFHSKQINADPDAGFTYLNVSSAGIPERKHWPLHLGQAEGLPEGLDGLLLASDLQGHADPTLNGGRRDQLVGEYLPSYYCEHYKQQGWPEPNKVGVILAGDLFALPHKRGGLGETRQVWEAFAMRFAWCVGVLGNHDLVDGKDTCSASGSIIDRCCILDGDTFDVDGFVIGGVGGVIGRSGKANRRPEHVYTQRLIQAITDQTGLLVIHEAPDIGLGTGRSNMIISEVLNDLGWHGLVVCGHSKWRTWYHPRDDAFSVLNTEGRAVLLIRTSNG